MIPVVERGSPFGVLDNPGQFDSSAFDSAVEMYPNKPDKKTAIVCFHGRPSLIEAQKISITTPMATYKPQNWIAEYWR